MHDKGSQMPDGIPVIRTIAMPADTNPSGDIFGGWLMSVAVEAMSFLSPVAVGDEVSLFANIARVGRTSLRIEVEAWRRARESEQSTKVTEAVFTFVAIDGDGRPRTIPAE